MSLISNFRCERLLLALRQSSDPAHPETRKNIDRLVKLGAAVIDPVLQAVGEASRQETLALVEVLTGVTTEKTLGRVAAGLAADNPRTLSAVSWALSGARSLSCASILDLLKNPEFSRTAVIEVIAAQKDRFATRELLLAAHPLQAVEKSAIYKLVADIADHHDVPEMLARLDGKDPIAKKHLLEIIGKFQTPAVEKVVIGQLRDPNKFIRHAALNALLQFTQIADIEPLVRSLADADIEVQNRAIDVLLKVRNPNTVRYLLPVLQDESEYARRSAVEVLNELGDASNIKYLLQAIKDADWWVRSRAADALGKIGGPRVVDAVLELLRDPDEELRRTAIEILNLTRDTRAISALIAATRDADWWVSERAIDALGKMREETAIPRLLELLTENPKAVPCTIRALGNIGNKTAISSLLPFINNPDDAIRSEALAALSKVTDQDSMEIVRREIAAAAQSSGETVQLAARRALELIDSRMSGSRPRMSAVDQIATSRTMLAESADVAELVRRNEAAAPLDISTLKKGDVLEERYRFIEKIGKGAFGTVLLMEDTVVGENLILKFLNPNISQDEEMMKRFVHELRYSRKITHPNVIRIYDFLYIRGNYAISMEYFKSHTLGGEIINEQPLPLPRALRFSHDIAAGMAVAHEAGVIHRDLKPANILIDDQSTLKIVDFGVAAVQREGDTQLTKTGYVIGSPKYMAPEQILGKEIDPRSDIYSLGILMYEMTTGIPPYSRGDHMAVMYQHVQGKAKPPREVNPAISPELSTVIMSAMSVDKEKRPQSMAEFRDKLARLSQQS